MLITTKNKITFEKTKGKEGIYKFTYYYYINDLFCDIKRELNRYCEETYGIDNFEFIEENYVTFVVLVYDEFIENKKDKLINALL